MRIIINVRRLVGLLDELNKRPIYKNKIRMTLFKLAKLNFNSIELVVKHKNLCTDDHLAFLKTFCVKQKILRVFQYSST